MRDIAASARMSLATVYRYCASKDHLIAEAHVDWLTQFRARLRRRPPAGRTAAERVSCVLGQMCRSLDRHPELTLTILRALYAPEPAVQASKRAITGVYTSIIDDAIGDEAVADRPAVIEVLGHVVDSALSRWASRSMTSADAAALLDRTARLLLGPA